MLCIQVGKLSRQLDIRIVGKAQAGDKNLEVVSIEQVSQAIELLKTIKNIFFSFLAGELNCSEFEKESGFILWSFIGSQEMGNNRSQTLD